MKTTVPSIRDHLNIKTLMSKTKKRWTPLNANYRFAWSTLTDVQRRKIDSVVYRASSKRIAEHNKNFLINFFKNSKNRLKNIDEVLTTMVKNPNIALF
jgi:hypothetical protein